MVLSYRYYEDFVEGEVVDLGAFSLNADEIVEFARKYDPQPMHTDAEAAKASVYGGLIASGWHTAVSYMRLVVDHVLQGSVSFGSPGLDNLRWLKPVRPGDTLRGRFRIVETRPSNSRPDWGIVRSRGELVNQDGEVVMTAEAVNFFGRRPPG
ncbi:MAG: MaoC family dehydratase [Chloroflexi bacterium]|nr:MaoC family dehydratase [Chloroflexota bacterium]MBV9898522.1 MaoC family dehydratase [Chloroflexota bacterium]